jgi:hypothetical protein
MAGLAKLTRDGRSLVHPEFNHGTRITTDGLVSAFICEIRGGLAEIGAAAQSVSIEKLASSVRRQRQPGTFAQSLAGEWRPRPTRSRSQPLGGYFFLKPPQRIDAFG